MLPSSVTTMLAALAQAPDSKAHATDLKRFGRALLERPDDAAALLEQMAGSATAAGDDKERMSQLPSTVLDEARVARENGQRQGALFIDNLEAQLGRLVTSNALTFRGSLAVSRTWVRAGLSPPDILAERQDAFTEAVEDSEDPAPLDALLDSLIDRLAREHGGNVSVLHALFSEMLPTVPPEARRVPVRLAAARPPQIYTELGCAWLLNANAEIHSGAVEGWRTVSRRGRRRQRCLRGSRSCAAGWWMGGYAVVWTASSERPCTREWQSFPDSYRFDLAWSRALRLLGNAVPVTLAAMVAHAVAEVLRSANARRHDEAA